MKASSIILTALCVTVAFRAQSGDLDPRNWIGHDRTRPLPPVVDPELHATGRHAVLGSLALLAVGLLPGLIGMAGAAYLLGELLLGAALLACAWSLAVSRRTADARRLALASLAYLPLLFALLAIDKR